MHPALATSAVRIGTGSRELAPLRAKTLRAEEEISSTPRGTWLSTRAILDSDGALDVVSLAYMMRTILLDTKDFIGTEMWTHSVLKTVAAMEHPLSRQEGGSCDPREVTGIATHSGANLRSAAPPRDRGGAAAIGRCVVRLVPWATVAPRALLVTCLILVREWDGGRGLTPPRNYIVAEPTSQCVEIGRAMVTWCTIEPANACVAEGLWGSARKRVRPPLGDLQALLNIRRAPRRCGGARRRGYTCRTWASSAMDSTNTFRGRLLCLAGATARPAQ